MKNALLLLALAWIPACSSPPPTILVASTLPLASVPPPATPSPTLASCDPPPPKRVPLVASFCGGSHGYYWDGAACRQADLATDGCACDIRLQCDLFETEKDCEVAHAHCP